MNTFTIPFETLYSTFYLSKSSDATSFLVIYSLPYCLTHFSCYLQVLHESAMSYLFALMFCHFWESWFRSHFSKFVNSLRCSTQTSPNVLFQRKADDIFEDYKQLSKTKEVNISHEQAMNSSFSCNNSCTYFACCKIFFSSQWERIISHSLVSS